ncbi:MAG: histidinol-phosphate transaminase [Desulfobacterium sp.]|nr:histidinol-phosphate transaminase [Desulfobacterium sp.]
MKLTISEQILSIAPYEPGKPIEEIEREYGIEKSVKLASNENPLGPSPMAVAAVQENIGNMHRYPDGSWHRLRAKLAEKYGVNQDTIIIGNGSDDIIAILCHAFLDSGDNAVMPFPSFLMYDISVRAAGGIPVRAPINGMTIDLDAVAGAITPRTRMVFLTNPNNPTGSHFSKTDFEGFLKDVPENVLVIVDEAYAEFVRDPDAYNALETPLADPRIVCLRTFSKAYGLAGFRVGYGIMDPSVADILHRVRQPFNVNSLAQVAAAAALDDVVFLEESIKVMLEGVDYLETELTAMGLTVHPTQANFFLVDVKTDAAKVFQELLKYGVIVRAMGSYGYDTCLRVNAGLDAENKTFIAALKQVLNS